MSASSSNYLMGHTDHERRRLALQATILNPLTEAFLIGAGLEAGSRVLDLGCGVGEVTMIAAKLVGPSGHVTGIDIDSGALDIARARAAAAGMTHVGFEQVSIADHRVSQAYDAIIGRHILIHTADPVAILRQAAEQARPGGLIAFQEYDLSRFYPNTPPKPLYDKTFQMIVDLFRGVPHADIGVRLFETFHAAGLTRVRSRAEFLLDGGPDCPYYEWIAETVRSVLPRIEAAGIAKAAEVDVDTLAERLKEEALSMGGYLAAPIIGGTFGRTPSA